MDNDKLNYSACETANKSFVDIQSDLVVETLMWVPNTESEQILAMLCKPKDLPYMRWDHAEPKETVIQFWQLKYDKEVFAASLLFCVSLHDGPICAMKFCPSGGYTKDRLALLACTSVTGDVNILAVPQVNDLYREKTLTLKPVCVLKATAGSLGTSVDWDQRKGHTVIIGGYMNGMISMWRLEDNASQLLSRKGGAEIWPYSTNKPFTLPVRRVEMNNGYFMAMGGDFLKIFDISDCVEVDSHSVTVFDIKWFQWVTNSPYYVASLHKHSKMVCLNMQIAYSLVADARMINAKNSAITWSSFNPWLGCFLMGTDSGEIWMRDMCHKNAWNVDDRLNRRVSKGVGSKNKSKDVPERVRCVEWNPSPKCSKWFAVSYEKGMVRVRRWKTSDN